MILESITRWGMDMKASRFMEDPPSGEKPSLTLRSPTRSANGGRVQHSEQIAHQCAIAAVAPTIRRYGLVCVNLRPFAGGSVIAGFTSCSGAKAS